MSDREIKVLQELIVGLSQAQALIIQHHIKTGVIKKQDIANAFDFVAAEFKKLSPDRQLASPLQFIRARLDQDLPDFPPSPPSPPQNSQKSVYPDWFQGVIDGGKP